MFSPQRPEFMRRQWPCSKCGFACSSTWRSMNPTKPVVCNSCKSKANLSKSGAVSAKQAMVTETTDHPTSCDLKPSTLLIKVNDSDRKADSGPFVFGVNQSDQIRIDQQQQEITSKGKGKAVVASGDGQSSVGIEEVHLHTGLSLKSPYTLLENDIHEEINEDAAKKSVLEEVEKLSFWNAGSVKKKKRTKLPQFTPSPAERFFNHLFRISREQDIMKNSFPNGKENPLYDDLFIYKKCNILAEKEIGLGAMLLPCPSKEVISEPRLFAEAKKVVKLEPRLYAEAKKVVKLEPSEVAEPKSSTEDYEDSCMMDVKKSSPA